MIIYPYATGDLIAQPNSYFYSEYHGREFVLAWRRQRQAVLDKLPEAVAPPSPGKAKPSSRLSTDLLEHALAGDGELREAFVKKFEIHKRVHDGYDHDFRALDRTAHCTYSLYLRAADLFAATHEESGAVRHLNVYLKCLDTLCAVVEDLPRDLAGRLTWHLERERTYIEALLAIRGVGV